MIGVTCICVGSKRKNCRKRFERLSKKNLISSKMMGKQTVLKKIIERPFFFFHPIAIGAFHIFVYSKQRTRVPVDKMCEWPTFGGNEKIWRLDILRCLMTNKYRVCIHTAVALCTRCGWKKIINRGNRDEHMGRAFFTRFNKPTVL